MARQFFDDYFAYLGDTESTMTFHRWSILTCVAAMLGRKIYVPLGHFKVWPNMFVMLIGSSGSRKTVAIKPARELLASAGYNHFAADRSSREKFLMDMQAKNYLVGEDNMGLADISILSAAAQPAEMFIAADEFQDFLGQNNIDFIATLGKLWETGKKYEHKIKTGKSSIVYKPVVNLLGGNTPTGFMLTFPPEVVGQGFLSRMLLIYGEVVDRRITWPRGPDEKMKAVLLERLKKILMITDKHFEFTSEARKLIDKIYHTRIRIDDARFLSYSTRRHDHLLKLCSICAVMGQHITIDKEDVLMANTILYNAEKSMPLALGEFGKGKHSEETSTILEALNKASIPMSMQDLWKCVAQDLNSQRELVEILRGLQALEKVQTVVTSAGAKFLACRNFVDYFTKDLLLNDFLTDEEAKGGIV